MAQGDTARIRGTRPYQRNLAEFRAKMLGVHQSGGTVTCWLCNQPVDMSIADIYDDEVFEPDHVYPVADYPEHATDPDNLRPSHRGCNRTRGTDMEGASLGWTSIDWEALAD